MRMRGRDSMWDDDSDLQVFVPGLMATGILVSIGMLIWDGIKRVFPDVTGKQRYATRLARVNGRLSDLVSIESGEAPVPSYVRRVRRARLASIAMSTACWLVVASIAYITLAIYYESDGPLAGRGWTLSIGGAIASGFVWVAVISLTSALFARRQQPAWLDRVESHWPIGALPDIGDEHSIDA
jgi:hypothetical protein